LLFDKRSAVARGNAAVKSKNKPLGECNEKGLSTLGRYLPNRGRSSIRISHLLLVLFRNGEDGQSGCLYSVLQIRFFCGINSAFSRSSFLSL